jgi:hypothetical protein
MSNQEQIMSQLNDLQASATSLFAAVDLEKGKLPFEIAPDCTQHYMSWYSANEFIKFLGNGWRLPTRAEVPLLRDFFEFGVSFNEALWTSETANEELYDDDFDAWVVDTKTGHEELSSLGEQYGVVLVRDRSND